jgi:TonB family protein
MAICRNCGQKIRWYKFKRDLCPECVRQFRSSQEIPEASTNESAQAESGKSAQDYYDLGNLLSSIHIKEVSSKEVEVFSDVWAPTGYSSTKPFIASVVLHACLVALLYGLSGISWQQPLPLTREALEREYDITYYRPSDLLPAIRSPREGPKTPAGRKKTVMPPKGSTAFHPTQTVQSAPPKADNPSQTIVQPSTPNVLIKEEVKVPNLVIWNVDDTRIETIQLTQKSVSSLLNAKMNAPQALMKPPDPEMKEVEQLLSDLKIAQSEVVNQNPKLALAPGASPEWRIGSESENSTPIVNIPGALEGNSQLRNMAVLSANPGLPGPGGIRVPPGNRTGEFSISPDGNRAGSPDGIDGGELGGGVPGGGGSGKGSGNGFGGGGSIAQIQIPGVSVQGGKFGEGPTIAGPGRRPRATATFSEMVTIDDPGESYNITVVEGRSGGAGLGVYGVLSGKRNYTVFVPMPGGRWIMQFSEMPDSQPQPSVAPASTTGSQLYLSPGDTLVQPRPIRKVDPGRPEDEELAKLRGMAVLYAVIRKDGGVEKVRVIRSLNPALDDRAIEALKQWKFKPARQGNNPIEVQALFGIPFRPQLGR